MSVNHEVAEDGSVWFTLRFSPDAKLVGVVRRFVSDFCESVLDGEARGLLTMATHELLENGVKYSTDGRVHLDVAVISEPAGTRVRLETRNRCSAKHREAINGLFIKRANTPNVQKFYQEMMCSPGRGGLGLARIMAEADMDIRHVIEGEDLRILGSATFPPQTASANAR